jgi:hypothetical protein
LGCFFCPGARAALLGRTARAVVMMPCLEPDQGPSFSGRWTLGLALGRWPVRRWSLGLAPGLWPLVARDAVSLDPRRTWGVAWIAQEHYRKLTRKGRTTKDSRSADAFARAAFKVAIEEKPAGWFMIRSRTRVVKRHPKATGESRHA